MRHHQHVGLLVYSSTLERALKDMSHFFSTADNPDPFRLLPESALGSALTEFGEEKLNRLRLKRLLRPGEILALQRRHVAEDCSELVIEQRLYRGDIADPKTTSSIRKVGIPSQTARELREWMTLVDSKPEAWVFASENPAKPMWRDNVGARTPVSAMKPVSTRRYRRINGATASAWRSIFTHIPVLKRGGGLRRCWRTQFCRRSRTWIRRIRNWKT